MIRRSFMIYKRVPRGSGTLVSIFGCCFGEWPLEEGYLKIISGLPFQTLFPRLITLFKSSNLNETPHPNLLTPDCCPGWSPLCLP